MSEGGGGSGRDVPYGSKVDRVYRVLLSRKMKDPTWYRIAKEAGVSYSWAFRILKGLEAGRLIDDQKILRPKEVFMQWVKRKDTRLYRDYNIQNPSEVLRGSGMSYALTGRFAESLVGHYVFPRSYELYIHRSDAVKWHGMLTEHGLVGSGNMQLLMTDEHVFFETDEVDGWPVVSSQQLIADLYRIGAECAEAADLLVSRMYR